MNEFLVRFTTYKVTTLQVLTIREHQNIKMKSNVKEEKNEFQASNELAESSEDTSSFFDSSSTLNNEKLYKASAPEQCTTNSRLRSRMKMQQVCDIVMELNNFFTNHN